MYLEKYEKKSLDASYDFLVIGPPAYLTGNAKIIG